MAVVVTSGEVLRMHVIASTAALESADSMGCPSVLMNGLSVSFGIRSTDKSSARIHLVACADLVWIAELDAGSYTPVAPRGELSPFSTIFPTGLWHWALKPDIVLEGGNGARDLLSAVRIPSLSRLTPHHQPVERLSPGPAPPALRRRSRLDRRLRRWRPIPNYGRKRSARRSYIRRNGPAP